ncbi:hypothetical protein R1flu_005752 [Riccia fluitans]|uniref:BTB domain-containing protein n=1 Tax=Riccia fluitans TaxID=41844 RepID=A0ABD1YUA5_9MARC
MGDSDLRSRSTFLDQQTKKRKAHKAAISNLRMDMLSMINDPEYSDVTFVCKDGGSVHACSMLLVVRCPVLKKMLINGKGEVEVNKFRMPEIPSPVLLTVFEFLYTGEMRKHVSDWKFMFELISASRIFLLDDLEDLICEKLWADISMARNITYPFPDDMINLLVCRLSVACGFGKVLSDGSDVRNVDVICLQLVEFLNYNPLTSAHFRNLSEEAFRYFLVHTGSRKETFLARLSLAQLLSSFGL